MTAKDDSLRDARNWLWLGIVALGIAGLWALSLGLGRMPQLKDVEILTRLFRVALVVHVDLSVLMWFVSVAAMGWALLLPQPRYSQWRRAGFFTIAAATALMALSPLDTQHWQVYISNYIPVLHNLPFLFGLGLLAAGLMVMTLPVVFHYATLRARAAVPHDLHGFLYAAFTTLLALVAFALSAHLMPQLNNLQLSFETLFWAGGHILQATYTLLMMSAWIALVELLSGESLNKRAVQIAYGFTVLYAVAHLAGFALYPFDSPEFIGYHTKVMISLGGIGVGLLALLTIARLWSARKLITRKHRAYAAALIASLVVFIAGGLLGLLIKGQNVIIPAHYHGAIVGVTLALMGLAYAMLPRFGHVSVAASRMAFWQPILSGVGQLLHIGGLAYSGGYGVLRKTPAGETPNLSTDVYAALGFVGLGTLMSVIGGLLFVVVMIRAFRAGGGK